MNGLDGSTETTPTVRSSERTCATSAPTSDDFPTPGGPVTPIDGRAPGLGIELADERIRERIAVLDERDRPRERAAIALPHARGQLLERPLPPRHAAPLYAAPATPPGEPARACVSARFGVAAVLDLLEEGRDPLEAVLRGAVACGHGNRRRHRRG